MWCLAPIFYHNNSMGKSIPWSKLSRSQKDAQNARRRERIALMTPKERKEYNLKRKNRPGFKQQRFRKNARNYGHTVTYDEAMAAIVAQGGACLICKQVPDLTLRVDHCHKTGKFRGMLCNSCNLMLGHAKDNLASLRRAADYLEEHG